MAEFPDVLASHVLNPGDRLVIVLRPDTTPEQVQRAGEMIDAKGFGNQVLFVVGIEQLAVLRGGGDA